MKICKRYEISFQGTQEDLRSPSSVEYWIQKDDGTRFKVSIPNSKQVIDAFEWLNGNDCLRHLDSVEPMFTSNVSLIEEIRHRNTMREEHAYATGSYTLNHSVYGSQRIVSGLEDVPNMEFKVTWHLWSREHAVMFKLACGGQ